MSDATIDTEPRTGAKLDGYLGWRAGRRPAPAFAHLLGAVAGAFAVVAMVAFVAAINDQDPQVEGIVGSLLLIALALALGAFVGGPMRAAGTTAIVLSLPLLWIFALFGDNDGAERGDIRALLLLTLVTYAAAYLVGWTRGRTIFLAGTLLLLWAWISFEVAGDGGSLFGTSFSNSEISPGSLPSTRGFDIDAVRTASLVLGLAYLVIAGLLDRARIRGAATPVMVIGAIAAVQGGTGLAANESELVIGLVAIAIGAAVGIIGAASHERRFTTWFGIVVVFVGFVYVIIDIDPDSSEALGAIATAFAIGIGLVAWLLARFLGEEDGTTMTRAPAPTPEPAPVVAGPTPEPESTPS